MLNTILPTLNSRPGVFRIRVKGRMAHPKRSFQAIFKKFSLSNIGWLIEGFLVDLLAIKVPVKVPVRSRNRRAR